MTVTIEMFEDKPLGISVPNKVTCEVMETEPALKGQTVSSSYKPALLCIGIKVGVPPFVNVGDRIIVNTELREYSSRAD